MKTNLIKFTAFTLLPAALLAGCCCSKSKECTNPTTTSSTTIKQSSGGNRGVTAIETVTMTSTVEAIDYQNRTVVLKNAAGETHTYKVGKEAINFDQTKVGDTVKTTIAQADSIYLLKEGPPPSLGGSVTVARAEKGEMPGGAIVKSEDLVTKVVAVDTATRMVTLQAMDGTTKALQVPPEVNLQNVSPGDGVVVRTTDAIAIKVERP